MGLKRQIAFNTIIQIIGRVITVLIALLIVVYLTRYLGVEGYGYYTMVIAYLGLFTILADFGFYLVTAREMAQNKSKRFQEKIFANTLTLRIFSGLAILLIANLIVLALPYPLVVKQGVWIFSIGILAMLLNQVVIILFQINLATGKIAIGDIFGRAITLLAILWVIKQNLGLNMVMWASSAGFILTLISSLLFGAKYIKITLKIDFDFWKKLLIEAWPIGVVLVLLSFYFRINTVLLSVIPLDRVVIPSAQGLSNAEATGLFGPPYRIMDTIIIFPAIFMGIVMPIFARFIREKSDKAKKILQKSMDLLIIAGVAVAFIIISLSPEIISLIGGDSFVKSVPVLQILGFYMASFFIIVGVNYFIVAMGRQKKLLKPYLWVLFLNLVIGVFGVYWFSYFGAAAASVLVNLILMIFGIRVLGEEGLKISLESFYKSLISGIIIFVGFYLLRKNEIMPNFENFALMWKFVWTGILVVGFSFVYWLFLCLLKITSLRELNFWKNEKKFFS